MSSDLHTKMGVAIFLMTMMVIVTFFMIKMAADTTTPTAAIFNMSFITNMTNTWR
jgi:hypothetical protein